jgi:hypothetical protein
VLLGQQSSRNVCPLSLFLDLSKCLIHSVAVFTLIVSFGVNVAYVFGLILFHLLHLLLHQVL